MSSCVPITDLILDELDAVPGLDHLDACLPWLEKVYASWQAEGAADQFPLLVAAATPAERLFSFRRLG